MSAKATLYIDKRPYQVETGDNLLQTCLSLGFDIPYFCWHPALGSVGACRQCAVKVFKDENDTRGRIHMACMTPVEDKMRISLEDAQVKEFHAQIIEWLMTNHPHDCPVCDEGGECHLQDMTVLSGHAYRRHRFPKRTFHNQNLGPFINHEMNRCITCYRCVRFYNEYAGGDDLQAMASKNHVYFGRHEEGALESEFSGNLVEVCPTGVFTDKTLKHHYARKWDMQSAPSICVHCALGCNTQPNERYGTLRRIQNRFHSEINGYFLCDRGRFGYGFVNSGKRVRRPLQRQGDELIALSKADALHQANAMLQTRKVIGIGSPRASLESNGMLQKLVGAENFYAGVAADEWRCIQSIHRILSEGPARTPSLHEVEQADAVLILGEDVTATAARLALAVRQALRQESHQCAETLGIPTWQERAVESACQGLRTPIFIATATPTRLDDVAQRFYRAAPDEIARLGFMVAHLLDGEAPAVTAYSIEQAQLAEEIARHLESATRPLIISGTSNASKAMIEAAANIARALCKTKDGTRQSYVVAECNSLGLAMLGARGLEQLDGAEMETLVVLENDLYRRGPQPLIEKVLTQAKHLLLIDHLQTPTCEHADLILPAATFAEASGTLVNNEGRAQRFFQVFQRESEEIQPGWRWLSEMMHETRSLDQVLSWLADQFPTLAAVKEAAPGAEFRELGQAIPRQSPRYSGRTAIHAQQTINEPKPPVDRDSPLAFSMEGFNGAPPAALLPRVWAPHWNSLQALNKFQQEVGGPLRGGDPGVRLISPSKEPKMPYFHNIPPNFERRDGEWLVVPLHHLFGSEELSLHTPELYERVALPYLGIALEDASNLGIEDGELMELRLEDRHLLLPMTLMPGLPSGLLALPQLPGVEVLSGPRWGALKRLSDE